MVGIGVEVINVVGVVVRLSPMPTWEITGVVVGEVVGIGVEAGVVVGLTVEVGEAVAVGVLVVVGLGEMVKVGSAVGEGEGLKGEEAIFI